MDMLDMISSHPHYHHIRRPTRTTLLFVTIFVVSLFTLYSLITTAGDSLRFAAFAQQTLNLTHLEHYNLSRPFTYSHRSIVTRYNLSSKRDDLTTIRDVLFNETTALHINATQNLTTVRVAPQKPLVLEVPTTDKTADPSIFAFGSATTLERLLDSVPQFAHWLPHSGASLQVVIPPEPEEKEELSQDTQKANTTKITSTMLEDYMQELGMNVSITSNNASFPLRYFSHLRTLYDNRTPQTRYLVLIDDDTFFPSLPSLINHLDKHYNSGEPHVIAPMSDDFDQVKKHGLMPFGGGGIFLTLPLVETLLEPRIFAACLNTQKIEGDQILADCIRKHTNVRPDFDMHLHQMDIKGNVDGFFESGRRFLSLHHWKSWYFLDIPTLATVSKACGNECILQRWRFEQGVVFANGYSIVKYPKMALGGAGYREEELDFDAMEQTWNGDIGRFEYTLGPLRPALGAPEKVSYHMVGSVETKQGVKQTYIHYGDDWNDDAVVELLWLK